MKIVDLSIDKVVPYDNNPRNNDDAVDSVAESIRQFGFKVPMILDKDNVIIAGHTRLKAAQKLGLETVPVIYADDLTEEQVKAFRLADNKTGELAEWDFALLESELKEIFNINMADFGFDEKEFSEVSDDEIVEDEVPELPEEPVANRGGGMAIRTSPTYVWRQHQRS